MRNYVAIDVMKLILDGKAYNIWTEIHHPHEPKIAEIEQLFERMSPAQRNESVLKAKTLAQFGKVLTDLANVVEKVADKKLAPANS